MLVRHTLIYALGRILPSALNFLAIALYTHLVLPIEYGRYGLAIATASAISTAGFAWLRNSIVRFLPLATVERPRLIGVYLAVLLLQVAVLLGAGGIAALLAGTPALALFIFLATLLTAAQSWCEASTELLRADLKPALYSLTYFIRSVIAPVFIVAMIMAGAGAEGMIAGTTLAWLLLPLANIRAYWREAQFNLDRALLRQFAGYGLPVAAALGLQALAQVGDRWIVSGILGTASAGIYGIGVDVTRQTLWAAMQTINLAALPAAFDRFRTGDSAGARAQLQQGLSLLLLIALPALVGITLLAGNICATILGAAYQDAAVLLPVTALAITILGIKNFYFDQAFALSGQTRRQIPVALVTCIVTLGVTLLLVPRLGIIGGAYGLLLGAMAGLSASILLGRKLFALVINWPVQLRTLAAALCMGSVLLPLLDARGAIWLAVQVATGAAIFAMAAWLLNAGQIRDLYRQRRA